MLRTVAGKFLTIFGIGWLAILGAMYLIEYLSEGKSTMGMEALIIAVPGFVLLVVGLGLYIAGSIGDRELMRKIAEKARFTEEIAASGIPVRARVTFVDKNYSLLVNQKPVYSIVEYTYEDHLGRPHIGRKTNVDSDLVIRAQLAVGSEVDVKYLASIPDESVLLIPGLKL